MCAQTRQISENITLSTPAAAIWALLGDFNSLYRWHPAITGSKLEGEPTQPGCLRNLTLVDGTHIQEALISLNNPRMRYCYRIITGPLPVLDYESEISVDDKGNGYCTVTWQSSFRANGVPAQDAEQVIRGIYQDGLAHLAMLFS